MKRTLSLILIAALALSAAACTGEPGGASSQLASLTGTGASSVGGSSTALSSEDGASEAASSATRSDPSSQTVLSSQAATSSAAAGKPVDVDALFAASGKSMTADVSSCFPKDAEGYLINGGTPTAPYLVDAETLFRLTEKPVSGSGTVKWVGFDKSINNVANPDPFTGVVPVSKLHDPIYMSTALPSDAPTYMTWRINASNLYAASVTTGGAHVQAHLICAVYRNEDNKPKDSDTITLCISDFRLLFHSAATGWVTADKSAAPSYLLNDKLVFNLPWQLNCCSALPKSAMRVVEGNYVELTVTGAILNATALIDADGKVTGSDGKKYPNGQLPITRGGSLAYNGTLEEACIHFGCKDKLFSTHGLTAATVDGMVSAYRVWVKEPEMAGKVVAAIGIDQSDRNGHIDQAYSGRNYLITNEPRWIIGHTVGPNAYDTVMDTDKVQQLIGMK